MSQSKSKHGNGPARIDVSDEAKVVAQVRQLIADDKRKQAVELAKENHKFRKSPASEQLLFDAYLARIAQFQAKGAAEDANTLINLVRERFPARQADLGALEVKAFAGLGRIDDLLRPLARPDVPTGLRDAIENVLRTDWTDLGAVAKSEVLPADHPLRTSAAALLAAFKAVTSGPVTPEQISLPEISRRSPLAAWKLLIRAIAQFYQRDDEGCRRTLQAIAPDSAVHQMAPLMESMLKGADAAGEKPWATALHTRVVVDDNALRKTLAELETAFKSDYLDVLSSAVRKARNAIAGASAELSQKLVQHLTIRCALEQVSHEDTLRMIGAAYHNAYYWRLGARGFEMIGQIKLAAVYLNRFCVHALHEKLFTPNSAEAAACYFHNAELAAQISPHDLQLILRDRRGRRFCNDMYQGQPPEIKSLAAPTDFELFSKATDAGGLFSKSAALQADPQTFEAWLAWARKAKQKDGHLEDIARLWHQKVPKDPRPSLLLSSLAESRNALKLSLKHLADAEAIDAMNPAVRKARLRLTLGTTWKHFKDKKAHLVKIDLDELQALPAMQEGDRVLFMDALRVAWLALVPDAAAARAGAEALVERAGNLLGPALLDTVSEMGRLRKLETWPHIPWQTLPDPHAVAEAEARALSVAIDLNLTLFRPAIWDSLIRELLKERPVRLSVATLIMLALSGKRRDDPQLAYLAAGAGLESATGINAARLLLRRGECLPDVSRRRAAQCLRAAMELLGQANDADLISEISNEMTNHSFGFNNTLASAPRLSGEQVSQIIAKEREAIAFPRSPAEAEKYLVTIAADAERKGPRTGSFFDDIGVVNDDDDDDDDFFGDDDEDDEDDDDLPFNFPGPGDGRIIDELRQELGDAPSLDALINSDPKKMLDLIQKLTGIEMDPDTARAMANEFAKTKKKRRN